MSESEKGRISNIFNYLLYVFIFSFNYLLCFNLIVRFLVEQNLCFNKINVKEITRISKSSNLFILYYYIYVSKN